MTETELKSEIKKAVYLYEEMVYESSDLESHIISSVKEFSDRGEQHKTQLERIMYLWLELRKDQRLVWAGHKNKIGACKKQEAELDKKINYLLTTAGYSIDRYKDKVKDNSLF